LNQKKINNIPPYSIIVPVYNRPREINELLNSLTKQTYTNFEVIIIEDGSTDLAKMEVEKFRDSLNISYHYKNNSGPGPSRNEGMKQAKGDFFIILDSDVIVPPHYMSIVHQYLQENKIDAYGGPDKAMDDFTPLQKAIDFAMTSFLTTGGIRGKAEKFEKFHPRSFNMGLSKKVFNKTKGFSNMRFGEDIDLSIRIIKSGFKTALIKEAYVFHKRRNTLKQFFKQIYNSGIARINLYKKHPDSLKAVHFLPLVFSLGLLISLLLLAFDSKVLLYLYISYLTILFLSSSIKYRSIKVGALSIITSFLMLIAYAAGFLKAIWKRIILRREEFSAYSKNFYK
jgi:glycosyltransferase involved in cell wall biosynthesis